MVKDMSRRRFIGLLALALGVVGCGDGIKRVPVKGKLTAKGTPIEGGYVQFIPGAGVKGEGGIGLSDRDGNFSVKGFKGVVGVAPGEYRVRVSRLVMPDGTPLPYGATEADNPGCRESIPAPYGTPQSPLKFTVPGQGGTIDVDLPVPLVGKKK